MRLYGINIAKEMDIQTLRKGEEPVPATKLQMIHLGDPIVLTDDRIVAEADMQVGEYTVAASPDVPRTLTVEHSQEDELDELGYIEITGDNILDEEITETVVPEANDIVETENIFKTVTKVEGFDWAIDTATGTEDILKVGVGNMLGIPIDVKDADQFIFALLGTEIIPASAFDGYQAYELPHAAIDVSGATYDGSKTLYLLAYYNYIYQS